MTGGAVPDPFAGHPDWAPEPPRPIVPTPATMGGQLRGRGCSSACPGHGWRGDLRADEKVVQGSRTYVPVMPEARVVPRRSRADRGLRPAGAGRAGLGRGVRGWRAVGAARRRDRPGWCPWTSRRAATRSPRLDADALTGRRVVQLLDGRR